MPFTCFASLLVLCNICLNIACTFDGALFLSLIFLSLHYQMFYLVMFVSAVRISSLQCFCLQFPFQVYELPNSVTPLSMVILIIIRMCFFILTVLWHVSLLLQSWWFVVSARTIHFLCLIVNAVSYLSSSYLGILMVPCSNLFWSFIAPRFHYQMICLIMFTVTVRMSYCGM